MIKKIKSYIKSMTPEQWFKLAFYCVLRIIKDFFM